jgi:hypothetical protein
MIPGEMNPAARHSGGVQKTVQHGSTNGPKNKPSALILQTALPVQCFGLVRAFHKSLRKLFRSAEPAVISACGAEPISRAIAGTVLNRCNVAIVECRPVRELEWHLYANTDCTAPCVVRSEGRTL